MGKFQKELKLCKYRTAYLLRCPIRGRWSLSEMLEIHPAYCGWSNIDFKNPPNKDASLFGIDLLQRK